jgi:hypothetical protein
MRLGRLLLPLALVPALAAPATAGATTVAHGPTVKLLSCDTDVRTADFEADMRTVPGAARLQIRFTLQVRDDATWTRVAAPTFDVWTTAAPGRSRYVYDKHVSNLQPGAYRAQVRFRWRDALGETLKSAVRRSRPCRVPDPRPDLRPLKIVASAGPSASTRSYAVTVVNGGRSASAPFDVSLAVGGMPLADQGLEGLAPGERATATFVGPVCADDGLLVASVDPASQVDEADEGDDVLSVPCAPA